MLIALKVLEIVAPVFLLTLAGWLWVRRGLTYDIEFITRMAMSFAVPCLLFSVLTTVDIDRQAFRAIAVASVALYAAVTLGAWFLSLALGLDRRTYLAPLSFGNTGNIGLPLCLFAFGEIGLAYAAVVFAVMAAISFTAGIWMVTGGASPRAALTQPIFAGAALGILWAAMDWPVPVAVANTLQLAGQMAIPMMLMTLGVSIAKLSVHGLGKALALTLVKVVLGVGIATAVAHWLRLDEAARGVLILQAAMPVAVTSYLLAERYEANPTAVAGLVVVSTLVAAATMPVLLAFLV